MTTGNPTLRTRLALLYGGLFFAAAAALIAFVDLPMADVNSAQPAPRTAGAPTTAGRSDASNLHELLLYSGIALVVAAGLAAVLGRLMADRALRPFRAVVTSARRISAGNLQERLALDSPYAEFNELGATLDDLFGRLEASFDAQRHFVANASHELRTPLTVERTLLQVALDDPDATVESLRSTCQDLLAIGRQQQRLIEALLTLADSERELDQPEPFDLADLAGTVLLTRRQEAGERDVRIDATLAPAPAAGDPSLMTSLLANLLDNALHHNVPGGRVELRTGTDADGRAAVSVGNTGAVVPPSELARLFQPFQRLDTQRTHRADSDRHGLGLAIVAAIARAHRADLAADARPEGGLDIRVTFETSG
ncbi:HAMP domain-containing sensor histidine kinase [Streptacidiphilus sp. N1-10]|uniref:histidine kinase n=1 Tax=Streptacidiphilus jeojiensis TaxID=3229225 RepID=A0ABV6XQT5_9ACTN